MHLRKFRPYSPLPVRIHISLENLGYPCYDWSIRQSWHLQDSRGQLWKAKTKMMLPLKQLGCQINTCDCSLMCLGNPMAALSPSPRPASAWPDRSTVRLGPYRDLSYCVESRMIHWWNGGLISLEVLSSCMWILGSLPSFQHYTKSSLDLMQRCGTALWPTKS